MPEDLKEKYLQQFNFEGIKLDADLLFAPYPGATRSVQGLLTLKVGNVFDESKRSGLNVALVLDVSGSMEGSKLTESKNAIKYILENMIDDDLYHLIIYSDKASLICEGITTETRGSALLQLNGITATGSTNLYEGYMLGVDTVLGCIEGYQDTSSVFLFSDGQITAGESNHQKISDAVAVNLKKGVRSTTFGIGHDHDEKLMSMISRSGGSDFHYINTAERIPVLIKKAIKSAQSILTEQGRIRICGRNGVCAQITTNGSKTIQNNGWHKFGVAREHSIINIPFELTFIGALDLKDHSSAPSIYVELDAIHKANKDVSLHCRGIDYDSKNINNGIYALNLRVDVSSFHMWQDDGIKTDRRVESYYLLDEVTKMDRKVAEMITSNCPIQEIIEMERQILAQLEPILLMDETMIAQALYEKIKSKVEQHVVNKRLTEHDKKESCYVASRYDRCEEEEDCDMGFALFD